MAQTNQQIIRADIAIVGGGMAGSTAAAVFGRDRDVALIDQHSPYPPVFAADKIAGDQIGLLKKLSLFEPMIAAATPVRRVINAQFGRVTERHVIEEYGVHYQTMVETMRAQIPARVARVTGHVSDIDLSEQAQSVRLSDGREIEARLVVLATGFVDVLRAKVGVRRRLLKENHSLSFGFDMKPKAGANFAFPSLTYYGDRTADAVDYISIFPVNDFMRANLFVYRDPREDWVRGFRRDPQASVYAVMPGLRNFFADFEITGPIQSRSMDLYTVEDQIKPGLVLIGDASQTSCPALGTGLSHLLTDVERLHSAYLDAWFATAGMATDKVAQFYADPAKLAVDARALHGANYRRAVSTQMSLGWELHRRQVYWRKRLRGFIQRSPIDAARIPVISQQS